MAIQPRRGLEGQGSPQIQELIEANERRGEEQQSALR